MTRRRRVWSQRSGPRRLHHARRPRFRRSRADRRRRRTRGGRSAENPKLHHGTRNAVFVPAVIRFNARAESLVKERRLERMAAAMRLGVAGDVADAIRAVDSGLGWPKELAARDVERAGFDAIIDAALADPRHETIPRDPSAAD